LSIDIFLHLQGFHIIYNSLKKVEHFFLYTALVLFNAAFPRNTRRVHHNINMSGSLRAFTTNSSRQLNIFWHDRDALGVNRAQVGVFKQASQVRFGRFLQRQDSVRLESQVSLEVLGDFSDQALKRQLADQEFGRFLVFSNLSQRYGTRSISVRFLDTASRRSGFARSFSRELLSRGFTTGGFTSSLFRTSHG